MRDLRSDDYERENETASGCSGPKQDLIAAMQVPLERGALRIAREMREVGPPVKELMDMKSVRGRSGRARLAPTGVPNTTIW